ncbi:MAG: UDP-2,3-diacylglucosamine diphosphatase [Chlorobiaceae bacterium]
MKSGVKRAVYFISDIHVGLQDEKSEHLKLLNLERLFAVIKADGCSLYMLGDILDYWMEFRHVIPKGFTRLFCLLSDLVQHNIEVVYVAGNHDFFLGRYFDDELGVKTLYGMHELPIDSYKFIIAHGDGLGKGDIGYKLFARLIRSRFNLTLLSGFHPDMAIGFMKRLSQLSRKHKPDNRVFETDRLLHFAESLAAEKEFDYFLCGHNHVRSITALAGGQRRYVNLGTWIEGATPYGVFKDGVFQLKELSY